MSLIERMKISMENMTAGEKILASLQVTLLGIFIVFVALAVLYFLARMMDKINHNNEINSEQKELVKINMEVIEEKETQVEEMQLIAVITAAVACSLHTSTHNIVVRNILRMPDNTPPWCKIGRMEQINSRKM
jgi:glutaconyl-CoA/methylmalonyl-CoA decarboxylase subunit delta